MRIFILLAFLIISFVACNQEPTSIGSELIPNEDKITFKEFDSYKENIFQSSSAFEHKLKLGTSSKLLLGKFNNSESSILFRFSFSIPDSILNYLKTNQLIVKSASMQMIPKYTLGDKNALFDFRVHQIRSEWSLTGFDKDSIAQLKYDVNDVASSISVVDTLVKFDIKPEVVIEWLKAKLDASAPKNYGILLKPKPSTQRIIGFDAVNPEKANLNTVFIVALEKAPNYKDTLKINAYMDTHVLTGTIPTSQNNFFVEGSFALRSFLFFDLKSLPKNIIINKATLELNVDPSKSYDGLPKSDTINVQILADSTTKKLTADSTYRTILGRKEDIFTGDVTWIVQNWQHGTANYGMLLFLDDEEISAARIAFYGSKEQNKALRPRLKIIYSQKK